MVCATFVNTIAPHWTTNLQPFASVELLSSGGATSIFQCTTTRPERRRISSHLPQLCHPSRHTDGHLGPPLPPLRWIPPKKFSLPRRQQNASRRGVIGYRSLCSYCLSYRSFSAPLLSSSRLRPSPWPVPSQHAPFSHGGSLFPIYGFISPAPCWPTEANHSCQSKPVQAWRCFGWAKPKEKHPGSAVSPHTQDLAPALFRQRSPRLNNRSGMRLPFLNPDKRAGTEGTKLLQITAIL